MIKTLSLPHVQARRPGRLADVAGVVLLLAAAIPMRLVNLDQVVGKFDEGIRGAQLLLMAAGFRPFRDIFASQGPLSLDVFYPTFMLFGQTLGAARLAPVILSVVGLLAVAWAARMVGGPVGGAVAGLVLLLSPTYLKNSRLALVEVPALVPATAAVGAALAYQRSGDRRWLLGAAGLFALALLIKPMVLPAAIPIGLLILLRGVSGDGTRGTANEARPSPSPRPDAQRQTRQARPADLALFGLTVVAVAALVILAVGPAAVYDQMVRFRMSSRRAEGWSLTENWQAMSGELADEQVALFAAAIAAGGLLLACRPRIGLPLVAWPLASFGLLMAYSPLQFKHAVIMLPPLALLVGAGAGVASRQYVVSRQYVAGSSQWKAGRRLLPIAYGLLPAALALWYLASLPQIVGLDRRVMQALPENRPEGYDDEIGLIRALSRPSDFIVVDEPSVAFAARRLVPPTLVDTSSLRIRSRSLGAGEVIAATEARDVRLLFLFSDGLRSLRRFGEWVDERYVPIKINERRNGKDRAVYLRRDGDFESARATLERTLERPGDATFSGQMRLLGWGLDRGEVRPGGSVGLTVGWEAIGPVRADYHVVTMLRGADGTVVEQNERALGGGDGTAGWEAGRWVFRGSSLGVRASQAPGEYQLAVGLYDPRARRMLLVDGTDSGEAALATVRVRG